MNRRTFVNTSLLAVSAFPFSNLDFLKVSKPAWILEWIKIQDKQLPNYQKYKDLSKKRREFVTSINKIINTYNVSLIDFKDFIREYKKIIFSRKIIRNIYCSLPYTLDRKFSIRIS